MSADAFERELAALGVQCRVEGRSRLAVLQPKPGDRFDAIAHAMADIELRRRIGQIATSLGFSHVAVELPGEVRGETA